MLEAGGGELAAEEPGELVHALRAIQALHDSEGARFGHALGHLEMRPGAGSNLRQVTDTEHLMVTAESAKFVAEGLRGDAPDSGIDFLARISTTEPVENSKFFEGRLAGYADGVVKVEVKGRIIELPLAGIRKANLVVEL